MSELPRAAESDDPRVYFAAERTLLAWIRTGLALMGFGFIVARFGLFLRELAAVHNDGQQPPSGYSLWIGVALVLLGVSVTAWSAYKHHVWVRELRTGRVHLPQTVSLATIVGFVLAALGLAIAAVLLVGVPH